MTTFEEIYKQHADMVYNLSMVYLQNLEDAQEATQDVFVKIHTKLSGFKGDSSIKTWVYKITVNTCLDRLKSRNRKEIFLGLFGIHNEAVTFEHPGAALESKESVAKILKEIDSLPKSQKTALLLKTMEDLPQKEIAEILNISEKAVESLLSRARKTLKEKLGEG